MFCTPLHIAADYGNISAIELLVDSGANVDECDSGYLSPLECNVLMDFADEDTRAHEFFFDEKKAIEAAVRLIRLGAATGIVLSYPGRSLLNNLIGAAGLSELLFQVLPVAGRDQVPPVLEISHIESFDWAEAFWTNSAELQYFALEFEQSDFGGKSLMHEAICWRGFSALPVGWESALQMMTPFPWHYRWRSTHLMKFLTTSFKLYRRQLPHDVFARILHLQPERGMSPLCRASSLGVLEVIENCLTMGAEIDFEGCSLGSALIIACACGRFEAVTLLVRRGAAISYFGKNGLTSAVIAGRRSKAIIAWLLVGQFNEQKRLIWGDRLTSSDGMNTQVQLWSGIGKADFRLVGIHQMQHYESSLDYAIRLSNLKRKLRGSIISQGRKVPFS